MPFSHLLDRTAHRTMVFKHFLSTPRRTPQRRPFPPRPLPPCFNRTLLPSSKPERTCRRVIAPWPNILTSIGDSANDYRRSDRSRHNPAMETSTRLLKHRLPSFSPLPRHFSCLTLKWPEMCYKYCGSWLRTGQVDCRCRCSKVVGGVPNRCLMLVSMLMVWTGYMTIVVLRTWLAVEVLMVEKLATRVEGFFTY